ncbi:YggS family pyridoxal phosphate-dependent enzyme [Terrilactibacillus laevilacticus]|uniref:Pyridoxal phosphate homeostasis protein n=1 Tax=Terrilactibacillus laevilacticus TaxID=1380157 RepID=A0ABW5PQ11_9BACI|nr:YggS family pyridoxal phosphate-dependent enzyme [Terrilactibacillus laevilacticus]
MNSVKSQLDQINMNIREACEKSGRSVEDIKIIGVTKYVSPSRTKEAIDAGIKHIGENRMEGLLHKQETILRHQAKWHFIGTLQTRKVKEVLPYIDYLHSLDRLSLAKEIEKRLTDHVLDCFVQVNVSGEESKHGISCEDVIPFIQELKEFKHLRIIGLMTMAPFTDDQGLIRHVFRKLKESQLEVQNMKIENAPCTELSMGMSNDYRIAIEEGATFVRIGTALVGKDL